MSADSVKTLTEATTELQAAIAAEREAAHACVAARNIELEAGKRLAKARNEFDAAVALVRGGA